MAVFYTPLDRRAHRAVTAAAFALGLCLALQTGVSAVAQGAPAQASSQFTPLISGGAGFFSSTQNGSTAYLPIIEPLLAAPLGDHLLIESRAALGESFTPKGDGQSGFDHSHFINLSYLEGEYTATPHLTIAAGSYLIPFNTFNERLSPIWISNFESGPSISGIGIGTGTGVGGMLRGSAVSTSAVSIDYAAWYSALSNHDQFSSERSSGGRVSFYFPVSRLEAGASFERALQNEHENVYGAHLWWATQDSAFRLRSEFAGTQHVAGYWAEADYRTLKLGDGWKGRFEPLFRLNQTFRRDTLESDTLPLVNTQRADIGLDYNLPHNTRIVASFSRSFSANGDENTWQTGIVYRLLFPAWKGR
jgi:hypothetical protein